MTRPATVGELRSSGYEVRTVRDEMRLNLIAKLRANEPLFEGIVGYEESVVPQIQNAILSGQDIVMLGERGQAKTRIARSLVGLLDDATPIIAGSEINDSPYEPVSAFGMARLAECGDRTPIEWVGHDRRYGEKLATPDTTIADLIGEVDPIKVAEGRYLSDELTIHYGLVPRANRGIFCINELPDLAERIQVGLLNIMEERDIQIRGYRVRLPLDVFVIASANPEDYTNRGRIITPLKDRFGSEIRTHYPRLIAHEIEIMEAEAAAFADNDVAISTPEFIKQIVAEITHLARKHPDISQRSGVSVRVSINNYENVRSSALRRAILLGEKTAAPRISDLSALVASTAGKIELESVGEQQSDKIIDRLIQGAVLSVFKGSFEVDEFANMLQLFENGQRMEAGPTMGSMEYVHQAGRIPQMREATNKLGAKGDPAVVASAVEFVLEGLHLSRKLNKDRHAGRTRYRR
jgi:magnesium chelatase subunit I